VTYKPGQWVILGTVLGAFIGLLLGKFALGLIFGFFAGIMIDSGKRRASRASGERGKDDAASG
jgi:zinc transporter ZupT